MADEKVKQKWVNMVRKVKTCTKQFDQATEAKENNEPDADGRLVYLLVFR